ncbi:alpha-L-fucosidase [Coraliomargarita algicola]|uniref:alpha-L-fucosidase n=1 Tax=Coraliomargarita algicola TaxID=3092156 RepID=A0ABZ0RJ32_9BACT|nr:alpha-L-fucosidase [Coraliomargarita sp. J2-16]WPJ96209.1 alpha-L-fucosidase [Coraliomargarita sp. J2-16]
MLISTTLKTTALSLSLSLIAATLATAETSMDEMWGDSVVKLRAQDAERGQLFNDGNYAMFVHWGLYSTLANKVDGKTYYGIGEWIMNPRMADIPVEAYMQLPASFNPTEFDAKALVQLAKDAGMKYIVITAKHHEGFAMYDSACSDFDIVDATPYGQDPLKALSLACEEAGIGLGVYYSHFQDWTAPGGGRGPKVDAEGNAVSFEDYFVNKCLPQIDELTSNYGPLELIWFDTPASISKEHVEQLIAVVRKNQPKALINGRAGHGLGDYQGLGDMEVPLRNVPGMWESVDTINDSWAYAWYDENWKSPKEILRRLIGTVARGGTYMLNVGPRGDGSVPERSARTLRSSGEWIQEYPQVVYDVDASPWEHALPWGDATVKGNKLLLSVFEWPDSGTLYVPGLLTEVKGARLLNGAANEAISFAREGNTLLLDLPAQAPDSLVSVIELELASTPKADPTWALDPTTKTTIEAEFCSTEGATLSNIRWMEKFGEWKHMKQVTDWKPGSAATWEVDVLVPGDYQVDLSYKGEDRLVWEVEVEGGEKIRNQQASSEIYQAHPMGWLHFPEAGRYRIHVRLLEGDVKSSSLSAIHFGLVLAD